MDCSTPGLPVHHHLLEFAQSPVHYVNDAIQASHHLPPSSPFASNLSQHQSLSSESPLRIRWPKNWSFSCSTNPSNEYSGLISFRIDWFYLLAVQRTLKNLLQHQIRKHQFFGAQPSLWSNSHIHHDHWRNRSSDCTDLCWQGDVSAFYAVEAMIHEGEDK